METNEQKRVRIVVQTEEDKRRKYKAKCALKGKEMTEDLLEYIDKTIVE